jgi:REP element-mobilizing transposase RayT
MSYIRIWVHSVWTTKSRIPYLKDDIRNLIINHIEEKAKEKNIYIDSINGYLNHLHALISLGGTQNISDIMHKIKGESSFWINKNKLTNLKFEWQDDFYCVSVGASQLGGLRRYIKNQEGHHQAVSWLEEIDELIKENNLQIMRG